MQNELLHQGANACSAALVAFILLLLVGAQILNWQWFLLIPAAAIGVGIYRTRKHLPSQYRVAQIVDARMELADTLSTALYFQDEAAGGRMLQEVRQSQAGRAEEMARTVDVRQAVPLKVPRGVYAMVALVLVASSLFALRYGLNRRLDLKPPLASMLLQQFGWTPKTVSAHNTKQTPPAPEAKDDDSGALADPNQKGEQQQDGQQNQDAAANGDQAAEKTGSADKDGKKQGGENGDQKGGDEQDAQAEKATDSAGNDQPKNGQDGKQGDQKQNSKPEASSSGDNSSLLSKVKDAMQNLMSRMKPPQGNQSQQQQQNDQASKQQGQGQQNGGKQQSSKNGQQQNGEQPGDAQDGQNGEEAKNQQDPQGKGTGKSDSQQASKQPGSGIGSQDGDKTIKQAEQLAAMGKISELLGKRSASITGEATVEVQNTSQQLHTQYVTRGAQHTQGGAEISRDEIPVALQNYVEQYFEQVRKQAPPAVKKQ